MKSKFKAIVIILLVVVTSVVFAKKISAQQSYVSFQVFYDQLSPYGEWVDYPSRGYVWIPDAGSDFVPYSTQGHWILTDYGWTWVSDFVWGWAPFHYGRWDYDNYYGWFWIPDNEWGPAWVSWRRAEGYYGWAPMEPGISLSVSFGRSYDSRNDHWIFVRDRDIDRPDINRYYVNRSDHDVIIRRSTVINNTYVDNSRHTTYVAGPAREDIQKVTGRRVNPVSVEEYNKPGQDFTNNHFRIYRPEVSNDNNMDRKSVPSRVTNLKDVKQPSERKVISQPRDINVKTSQPVHPNPPQNIRRVEQTKDVKSQNPNPPQNIKRVEQSNNVKSQNPNPPQNNKRTDQTINVKSQSTNTPQNIRRVEQTNKVKPQNANTPQNIKKDQRSNTSKQIENSKKEQLDKSNTEKDNKDNKDNKDKKDNN
ncbi:MAG TPA: DUF6600 domain-containing protein [Bacteroidales bacterium]